MTYQDEKYLSLAALMTDMSEDLIIESDIRTDAVRPEKGKRARRFSAFMNHPAMVAVLCAVVSLGVVVAIVLAGRGSVGVTPGISPTSTESEQIEGTETDILDIYGHVFCVGRTLDQILRDAEALGIKTLSYAGYTYIYIDQEAFLLARNDESGYVFEVEQYAHKTLVKEDFKRLEATMTLTEATEILGAPVDKVNNWGCVSFKYQVDEKYCQIQYAVKAIGEAYYGWWPSDSVVITVDSYPESDDYKRIYSSPEKTQPLIEFFDGLVLSPELDVEDPGQLIGMAYSVVIANVDGITEGYWILGKYVLHNSSDWMQMSHEDFLTFSKFIEATPTDAAKVIDGATQ